MLTLFRRSLFSKIKKSHDYRIVACFHVQVYFNFVAIMNFWTSIGVELQSARARAIIVSPGHNSEELYKLDSLGSGSGNSNSFSKVVYCFTYWVKN